MLSLPHGGADANDVAIRPKQSNCGLTAMRHLRHGEESCPSGN
jgi:hypothetical protein